MPRFWFAATRSHARRSRDISGRPFWHALAANRAMSAATQAVQRIRGRASPPRHEWPVEAQHLRAAFAGERQGNGAQWEKHAGGAGSQDLLRELHVPAVVLLEGLEFVLHLFYLVRVHLQLGRHLPQGAQVSVPLVQVLDDELRR